MKPAGIAVAIAGSAAVAAAGAAALGWIVARTLTAPISGRDFDLRVHGVEHDGERAWIVFDRTSDTAATGIYNLWFEHGGWAQLGPEIRDHRPDRIACAVTGASDGLEPEPGDRVSWSSIYYVTPADAGLEAREITIQTPAGAYPAWRVDGSSTWAIHIHGLGGTRAGTLRGVQVATELGYTSLAVTYRNDGERSRRRHGPFNAWLDRGRRRRSSDPLRTLLRCRPDHALRLVDGRDRCTPARTTTTPLAIHRWARARLTGPRLATSDPCELQARGVARICREARDAVAGIPSSRAAARTTERDSNQCADLPRFGSANRNAYAHYPRPGRPLSANRRCGRAARHASGPRGDASVRCGTHSELESRADRLAHHGVELAPANDLTSAADPRTAVAVRCGPEKPGSTGSALI